MTNFSGVRRNGVLTWLSPERALLVVPVLAGLGLSVLAFSVGITPLALRVKQQEAVVEDLSFKSEMLPLRRQELADLKQQQVQREQQLDRLLALVAGTSQLNTFLAELNDLAKSNGVAITTTKPGGVERFTPPPAPTAQEASPQAAGLKARVSSSDALLNKGLEKRSAGLTVKGPFPQVLAFLQSLERLQVFVIISEMDVKAEASDVTMNLKLTAYGRQPDANAAQEFN